jgi:hypothetical protein
MTDHQSETMAAVAAKITPPATVSLATVAGFQVSELVLWATLIYTVIMIGHKLFLIYKDLKK